MKNISSITKRKKKPLSSSNMNTLILNKLRNWSTHIQAHLSFFSSLNFSSLSLESQRIHSKQNGVLVISWKGPLCFCFHSLCLANVWFAFFIFRSVLYMFDFFFTLLVICVFVCHEVKCMWVLIDPVKYVAELCGFWKKCVVWVYGGSKKGF